MGDSGPTVWNGQSFGTVAESYEASRPTYPIEAVRWLIDSHGDQQRWDDEHRTDAQLTVADVGAGTGKLSEVLVALGCQVVAVEPDPAMLAVLRTKLPAVIGHIGTAEHIPLSDASVDAVVIAQAFHWVNPALAFPEIARVLKPGGLLGVVWNHRNDEEPSMAALTRLWGDGANAVGAHFEHVVPENPLFTPIETFVVRSSQHLDANGLVALTSSRSYVIALPDELRQRLFAQIHRLHSERAAATGDARFRIDYNTHAYRMRKR